MLLLPESPRYLLYKDNLPAARNALSRLMTRPQDSPEVDAEIAEISLVRIVNLRYIVALTPSIGSRG
jgi:hypothetical protein